MQGGGEALPDAEMLMTPSEVLWNGCCLDFAPLGSGPLTTTSTAAAAAPPMLSRVAPAIIRNAPLHMCYALQPTFETASCYSHVG